MIPNFSEQSINILSDIFSDNIAELAEACTTRHGRELIGEWLDLDDARRVMGFFEKDGALDGSGYC